MNPDTPRSNASPTVNVTRTGTGPPLVLLHGLGGHREAFDPIRAALSSQHEVWSIDLPGTGGSDLNPRYPSTISGHAAWTVDLLERLGVESPHVVGCSWSGAVALHVARSTPTSAVTAFSPVGFWSWIGARWFALTSSGLRLVANHGARTFPGSERLWVYALRLSVASPSTLSAEEAASYQRSYGTLQDFPGLHREILAVRQGRSSTRDLDSVPTTIVWGRRDALMPRWFPIRRSRRLLPQARHLELRGCGHVPFADNPALCAVSVFSVRPEKPARPAFICHHQPLHPVLPSSDQD